MKKNQNGSTVLTILLMVVVISLVGVVGWLVYDRQKTPKQASTTPVSQQEEKVETPETNSNIPEGWVEYQDTASNVSFYYPADWEESKFHVYKTPVSETIEGTNFGPYSAKYVFKKAENKWYAVNMESDLVEPYSGYTTITSIPANSYPIVYGYAGEGGGDSYYAVFTDGISSYIIELPTIRAETNPGGFDAQKQAIADLVATIKLGH